MTIEQIEDTREDHGHGGHKVTIFVNGRPKTVDKGKLSFEEVVKLAFPTPPTGDNIIFTVTYRKARGNRHDGILHPGQQVEIKEDTTFNVRFTDKS
jgi:hypothetical protein